MQHKAVLNVFSNRLPQQGQLLGPLGQDNNFPAFFMGLDDVLRYVLVARGMNGEKTKNILDTGFGRRLRGLQHAGPHLEACWCVFRSHSFMADRSALHKDDRMMPVPPHRRCGQAQDISSLCLLQDALKGKS